MYQLVNDVHIILQVCFGNMHWEHGKTNAFIQQVCNKLIKSDSIISQNLDSKDIVTQSSFELSIP